MGQLILELNGLVRSTPIIEGQPSPHDILRQKYLRELHAHTGRAVINYSTSWLENRPADPINLQLSLGDVQAFMETCSNVKERELDLIINSPGGSPEAADSVLKYLRTQFDHIRAIVPVAAMSAGTMLCLGADEIVLGTHSQLGPIDPQITVASPEGPRSAPAQAILDQFELAKKECADPANIGAWLPLLRSLMPGLLAFCQSSQRFSIDFAERVLKENMFTGDTGATQKSHDAAAYFSDFTSFQSHGRRIGRDEARTQNLKIIDLEDDKKLQDLVLSVHHAARLSFTLGVDKIVENQNGKAYISRQQSQFVVGATPIPVPPSSPTPAARPSPSKPMPGAKPIRNRR